MAGPQIGTTHLFGPQSFNVVFGIRSRMRTLAFALIASTALSAVGWRALGTWSGDGAKQTPSFTTSQREWRVTWTLDAPDKNLAFVSVVVKNDADRTVGSGSGSQDGETFVRAPAGKYYLQIASANVTWTVTAEEPQP